MANGKPIIPESITISDNGNASNTVTVTLTDDENLTVGNEPLEVLVEGGETILNGFNQSMEVLAYDLGAIDGTTNTTAYLQTNATLPSNTADVVLNGKAGTIDVTINDVRASAVRPFEDLDRDHMRVKVTKTATTGISVTDA